MADVDNPNPAAAALATKLANIMDKAHDEGVSAEDAGLAFVWFCARTIRNKATMAMFIPSIEYHIEQVELLEATEGMTKN